MLGIKGPSWLSLLPGFDIIKGMSVDYMHCVLLGVTRQVLHLWFDSKHHQEMWYLGANVKGIDDLLMSIKPTSDIIRLPREIQSSLRFWKGIY